MARLSPEAFPGPLDLVYIAGNLSDAETAERTLTEQGIDYALSLDEFSRGSVLGTILGGVYHGLFFFVPPLYHRGAAVALQAAGLTDTIPLMDAEEERSRPYHGT